MPARSLTKHSKFFEKREKYVRARLMGMTTTRASAFAGASHHLKLENDPYVVAKLSEGKQQMQQDIVKSTTITRQRVIDGLMECVTMAKMKEEPETIIRGWVEIAKLMDLYSPEKKEVFINVANNRMIESLHQMSDMELLEQVGGVTLDAEPDAKTTN